MGVRLPRNRYRELTPETLNQQGSPLELDDGTIIVGGNNGATIYKSTDDGKTFTSQQVLTAHPNSHVRTLYQLSTGTLIAGTYISGSINARTWRSTDRGETWTQVNIFESDSIWYLAELSNGDLYMNEYNQDSSDTSTFAYNVWKSTDDGANWSKFYTHPPGADKTDGENRTIRHLHMVFADSDDQLYLSMAHGYEVGTYLLNSDGTLGNAIEIDQGGGMTAAVQADNGDILFGSDKREGPKIFRLHQGGVVPVLDPTAEFGSYYNVLILSMCKGRDGVIYALANSSRNLSYASVCFASHDDGATWVLLKLSHHPTSSGFLTVGAEHIYLHQGIYDLPMRFRDYTRAELRKIVS